MNTKEYRFNNISVLEILEDGVVINKAQDILDIISDFSIKKIVLKRQNIKVDFFDLNTGFASEILQKATAYKIYIGIIGDFEDISNKNYKDFIYVSNQNKQILFKSTLKEIVKIFCK